MDDSLLLGLKENCSNGERQLVSRVGNEGVRIGDEPPVWPSVPKIIYYAHLLVRYMLDSELVLVKQILILSCVFFLSDFTIL